MLPWCRSLASSHAVVCRCRLPSSFSIVIFHRLPSFGIVLFHRCLPPSLATVAYPPVTVQVLDFWLVLGAVRSGSEEYRELRWGPKYWNAFGVPGSRSRWIPVSRSRAEYREAFCLIVEMICLNYLPETDSFNFRRRGISCVCVLHSLRPVQTTRS